MKSKLKEKTIDICRRIIKSGPESVKFDDRQDTIDATTAHMVVEIYDKLSTKNQFNADEILKYQWGVHKFWELAGELAPQ